MKRTLALASIGCVLLAGLAGAKTHSTPSLTGTWECVAHGFPQGDVKFTLYLTQAEDNSLTGWVASSLGSGDLSFATFKDNVLEIRINAPQSPYHLSGQYQKDRFSGTWSKATELRGDWEGKKVSSSPEPK